MKQIIRSMTGYARVESTGAGGRISWELRSVNHRYLDVQFKLPEEFRVLENELRTQAAARISRGKVEVGLRYNREAAAAERIEINQPRLQQLKDAMDVVSANIGATTVPGYIDLTAPLDKEIQYQVAAYSANGMESDPSAPAWGFIEVSRPNLVFDPAALPSPDAVLAAVEYVNSAQIADMSRRPIQLSTGSNLTQISSNWVAATYYVGAARLARISPRLDTLRFLTATAEHYNYGFRGARAERFLLNADDVTIGDLYLELYSRRGQIGVLMPTRTRLDYMVPHLARTEETEALIRWWCDALYMAPPVLARARSSSTCPTRTSAVITAAASK